MHDQASAWPRAVSVDLDRTLVDTVEDLAAALNQTLVELGLSPHSLDAVRSMVGGGLQAAGSRARAAAARLLELTPKSQPSSPASTPVRRRPCAICVWQASLAVHQQAGRHYPRPVAGAWRWQSLWLHPGEHRGTAEEAGSYRHPPRLGGPQRGTDRHRHGRRQCYPAHALCAYAVIDTLHELPAALALLAGRRGNPLDISNVCHCRAGADNLVASANFCVYWIDRLRRQ